jgi:outer membrane lipoprotein SlyB
MKSPLILAAALAATLSACATSPRPGYGYSNPYPPQSAPVYQPAPQPQRCYDCGQIVRIESVYGARENSRAGAVLGGVVGAVAGRELADDESDGRRNTATVVGAAAGAVAGNAIENRMIAETYAIHVRMDDGRTLVFNRNTLGAGVREGAYVRVSGTGFDVLR